MNINPYKLMNQVETDFSKYEIEELSELEKKQKMRSLSKKIGAQKGACRQKRRKRLQYGVMTAAAIMLLLTAGSIANPALAKSVYSKVTELLVQSAAGSKDEEEDTTLYSRVGSNSQKIEELSLPEEMVTSVTDQGVTISVEDLYCDGYYLYYTMRAETTNEKLNQSDGIALFREKDASPTVFINNQDTEGLGYHTLQRAEDGSYVVMGNIYLNYFRLESNFDIPHDGEIMIDFNINALTGSLFHEWDEQGEYKTTESLSGNWNLHFPVMVNEGQNEIIELNAADNGIALSQVTRTPTNLILEVDLPDMTQAPYNDPYNDPAIVLQEANGREIPWSEGYVKQNQDGSSRIYLTCMYTEATDLKVLVINKNVDNSVVAEIDFNLN